MKQSISAARNEEGFLLNVSEWTQEIALIIAKEESIELADEHWRLIQQAQNYFERYELSPEMRPFISYLKKEFDSDISSIALLRLFPNSPNKTLSKIAGLPKPRNCI